MDRMENLDFCLRYLMQQDGVQAPIPASLPEKRQLLRALMNIWQPQPIGDDYLAAQDHELQLQLQERGIVPMEEVVAQAHSPLPALRSPLIWQGDITRLEVDAIVNAANSQGLGCWHPLHACIDNAIHSAAGLQLRSECNRVLQGGRIATGGAIITPAYNLPCRWVVHTVGPIVGHGGPTAEQEEQLAECYRSSLRLAAEQGCRSIAFCCISTGEFHFPNRRAAEVAVATCREADIQVIFNVFKDIDYDIYHELLGAD